MRDARSGSCTLTADSRTRRRLVAACGGTRPAVLFPGEGNETEEGAVAGLARWGSVCPITCGASSLSLSPFRNLRLEGDRGVIVGRMRFIPGDVLGQSDPTQGAFEDLFEIVDESEDDGDDDEAE